MNKNLQPNLYYLNVDSKPSHDVQIDYIISLLLKGFIHDLIIHQCFNIFDDHETLNTSKTSI